MRLLLDTQVFLWFVADARALRPTTRATIAEAEEVFVSAASIWEAAIKVAIGKLAVDLEVLVAAIPQSGFRELPVTALHAAGVAALPGHHRDPFDRLLIAQAIREPLRLLTADAFLGNYSPLVEVVGA